MKIKYIYNDENNVIKVLYDNEKICDVDCYIIDESIQTNMIGESRLIWLKDNDPSDYVEMALSGRLQNYIGLYTKNYEQREERLKKQIIKKCADVHYASAIARELMMYEN